MALDPSVLDSLSIAPQPTVFELDPPRYASEFGRRTEAIFKHVPPAPMLLSPESGLVLYERVISTKAEHQLLDKLTRPKFYHHVPAAAKTTGRKGATHNPPASTSGPGARPDSGGPSHAHHLKPYPSRATAATSPPRDDARADRPGSGSKALAAATEGAAGGRGGRSRSPSPGRGGGGAGGGTGPGVRGVRRKPLYPDDGPLKDYFSKERSSVTATNVFTWGNRYKIGDTGTGRVVGGGGGGGGAGARGGATSESSTFHSYTPAQHKPPLRL